MLIATLLALLLQSPSSSRTEGRAASTEKGPDFKPKAC